MSLMWLPWVIEREVYGVNNSGLISHADLTRPLAPRWGWELMLVLE